MHSDVSKARLLMATRNQGKIVELKHALAKLHVEVCSLADVPGIPSFAETGTTFQENAAGKALAAAQAGGLICLADDSGLEVDALSGRPGVYSARFAGEEATDAQNNAKLLKLLQGIPPEQRTARFVCCLAAAWPDGRVQTVVGQCAGTILEEERGNGGFGYDPLFYLPELQKTFAELTVEEKEQISHRGQALRSFAAILAEIL
ncbi:MAG: XTP/dITP diphosphatase [Clostridia bacterium]|jgi:XTP/dITP diphosphohydrolase|nr:XTP/dITP diphosphatase [Clostridia bacterium]